MALTPVLMFTGQADEAMRLYASAFPDAEILEIDRWGPGDAGAASTGMAGSVKGAHFRIGGQVLRCMDSPDVHAFGFTPAVSFWYDCADEATFDAVFARLSEGGAVQMPPGPYPFARRFAWLSDRFGVSWQLSVPLEKSG